MHDCGMFRPETYMHAKFYCDVYFKMAACLRRVESRGIVTKETYSERMKSSFLVSFAAYIHVCVYLYILIE